MAYNTDLAVRKSTVINSGQAGVYLLGSSAYVSRSVIQNNGRTSAGSSGIEVNSGSFLDGTVGYNRIMDNANHEIFVGTGGSGELAYFNNEGYNSVWDYSDGATDAERYVYHGGGGYFNANTTFWGTSSAVPSGHFYGPVNRNYPLQYDYTGGSGASGVPALASAQVSVPSGAGPLLASAGVFDPRLMISSLDPIAESPVIEASNLRERMVQLREELTADPAGANGARLLRELFVIQLRDRADSLGEKAANMAAIAAAAERLSKAGSAAGPSVRAAGEATILLEIRDAMVNERYTEAAERIRDYGALVQGDDNRRVLLMERIFLADLEGRPAEALDLFEQFKAITPEGAGSPDYTPADYSILESLLRENAAGGEIAGASVQTAQAVVLKSEVLPTTFELGAGYPNPFRAATTIPLSLPEASQVRVEVYDLMGRRVATLAQGEFDAGRHDLTFTGTGLASGLYLVRAHIEPASGEAHVLTQKITFTK